MRKILGIILGMAFLCASNVFADQPVMNEAPRWAGGWGFQVRNLYRESETLIDKDNEILNPLGLKRRKNTTMLEGVYTWDRSVRATIKIPWVDQMRVTNIGGVGVTQRDRGLGDIVVGVPLRKYTNFRDWTQNFSFTPSIRMPTGKTSGDYPMGDGSTDAGFSFSYSAECSRHFLSADLFYWVNNDGTRGQHQGNELGFDFTAGLIVHHNGEKSSGAQIQLDVETRYKEEGYSIGGNNAGTRIIAGPAFTYFRGPTYFRAVYHAPIFEYALDTTVSYGHEFDVGVGWSF